MGISTTVPAGPADVTVDEVRTLDQFKAHVGVTHAVFDALDRLPSELARIDRQGQHDLEQTSFVRYNARIGDEVVGAATATFTDLGRHDSLGVDAAAPFVAGASTEVWWPVVGATPWPGEHRRL